MQDAEILSTVAHYFERTGYPELKEINVSILQENERKLLVLKGMVRSYFMKQMAQVVVMERINGYEVRNLLQVNYKFS